MDPKDPRSKNIVTSRFAHYEGMLLFKSDDGRSLDGYGLALPPDYSPAPISVIKSGLYCVPVQDLIPGTIPEEFQDYEAIVGIIPIAVSASLSGCAGEQASRTLSACLELSACQARICRRLQPSSRDGK